MFLQIHSWTDSFEVAFTAEQTLLFYFAFSVIIDCKLGKILIIILIAIRPCDWRKNGILIMQKLSIKCYGNLKDCCIKKNLHNKYMNLLYYCTATFYLYMQNSCWPHRLMLLKWKRNDLHSSLQRMLIFSKNSILLIKSHVITYFSVDLHCSSVF